MNELLKFKKDITPKLRQNQEREKNSTSYTALLAKLVSFSALPAFFSAVPLLYIDWRQNLDVILLAKRLAEDFSKLFMFDIKYFYCLTFLSSGKEQKLRKCGTFIIGLRVF